MTISIRRMSLGSGYKYLMESVARGDGATAQSSPLTRYYSESGTPPGRFMGGGLSGVNNGKGITPGNEVTEEMLFNMLGMAADPITGKAIGRASNRWPKGLTDRIQQRIDGLPDDLTDVDRSKQALAIKSGEMARSKNLVRPVAGFDLTFSVPKSISAAWAVADAGTQAVIYQAHQAAIQRTMEYAEEHTFFSRSGTNGVVQEQVRGVIAAAFDHWDSRAGDPQLHTHVVVQNRAQSLDGKWRTLDSRGLFKQVVTLSELHVGVLEDLLAARLGWGFEGRSRAHSDAPKYEVVGVSDALIAEFSQRSVQIESATNTLIAAQSERLGRSLTSVEIIRIRQQATLDTRPDKQHHSLGEQTKEWRRRAATHVSDPTAWVETLRDRNDLPPLRAGDLHDLILGDAAVAALEKVAERRSTFTRPNVLAEVHRTLHGVRFASPDDRIAVAERTADLALNEALLISAPQLHHIPDRFQRADRTSKFRGRGTEIYTTQGLLDAEERLLSAGRGRGAPVVGRDIVARIAELDLPEKDYGLSQDQALAVEQVVTSDRVLDVLVGPAGTGKSTSMAGLRAMWEAQHGSGSLIGLGPSAVAAEVLGDELGINTENTAKWLTEAAKNVQRRRDLDRLRAVVVPSKLARTRRRQIEQLAGEIDRWSMKAGQLVIIDEASLAGTFALDAIVQEAKYAGAKVLLVGDWAQLSPVEAGGAFSMLVRDRDMAPELSDVRRFVHSWERAASMGLRVGEEGALDAYATEGRIESGHREELLDALYAAWKHDVQRVDNTTGKPLVSLMIAGDRETVAELNKRARADLVAAGEVTEGGLDIAGGSTAGKGDQIVTRHNDRSLLTGRRWVKNGDAWTVSATNTDGSMTVRRRGGNGEVILPADYVREHVELDYATTAHRAQGRTVDTAHTMVSATTSRAVLYVSVTRGREANHLYVDTFYDPDRDTSHGPALELPAREVLRSVLANIGADSAAHAVIRREQGNAESIGSLASEYLTIARAAQSERWDDLLDHSGLSADQADEARESPAYGALLTAFRDAEARGLNLSAALPELVRVRELDTAEDVAAALHGRLDRWVRASASRRPSATRLVAGIIPEAQHINDPALARALTERAEALNTRARSLANAAVDGGAAWTMSLGEAPSDPTNRARWISELATVAAYRERWNVTGATPAPRSDDPNIERSGHQKRANTAADRARLISGEDRSQQPDLRSVPVLQDPGIDM